jgi:hypothetical protein
LGLEAGVTAEQCNTPDLPFFLGKIEKSFKIAHKFFLRV